MKKKPLKTAVLLVRCSVADKKMLKRLANESHLSMSAFVLATCLDQQNCPKQACRASRRSEKRAQEWADQAEAHTAGLLEEVRRYRDDRTALQAMNEVDRGRVDRIRILESRLRSVDEQAVTIRKTIAYVFPTVAPKGE